MPPDRSTGVQQGRLYYSEREMLTQARAGEHVAPADVVKLLERLARYRGPVSHEPQERWHIRLADEVELRNAVVEGPLGPLLGGGCEVVRAEPREGEQEPRRNALRLDLADFLRAVTDRHDGRALRLADDWLASARSEYRDVGEPYWPSLRGPEPKAEANRELSRDDETNSTTTTSVASVLRLTASRLRDPEHRWSEDPAVTLERLAERLEKDYPLAEARGFTDAQVERLAEALWAYEGDPAVDWKGVTDPQFGRQGEAVRLRAKAEVLLGAVFG